MSFIRQLKNSYHLLQAIVACTTYGFPAKKLNIIGVTGTDGKTTTSTLIYHMLKTAGHKVALVSTVAAYIGDEIIDTGFHVTSPDRAQLQRLLRHIVDIGYHHVVLESTSHGLDQHRLFGTWMKTAVVTNITHEHFDYHKTYENYVKAKAKIFSHANTAIINHDDQSYAHLKPYLKPKTRWIAYSTAYENTRNFPFTQEEYAQLLESAQTRFTEHYNLYNTIAAAVATYTQGVPLSSIIEAIKTFPGVPGRMQSVPNDKNISVIVDFAHTPNALKEALSAAKNNHPGKLIAVFGAAGLRDASKRPLMGKVASEIADEIVLTSEDPRTEDPKLIIHQIKSGISTNHGHIHGIVDRREAIRFALSIAKKGDCVILCGKGHEQSLNLDGKQEIPWSDTGVVLEEMQHLT